MSLAVAQACLLQKHKCTKANHIAVPHARGSHTKTPEFTAKGLERGVPLGPKWALDRAQAAYGSTPVCSRRVLCVTVRDKMNTREVSQKRRLNSAASVVLVYMRLQRIVQDMPCPKPGTKTTKEGPSRVDFRPARTFIFCHGFVLEALIQDRKHFFLNVLVNKMF